MSCSPHDLRAFPARAVECAVGAQRQVGGRFAFRKDLRRSAIFGRNDLVQDSPISKIDLLVRRNVLMYFNVETQSRILSWPHFALAQARALFLGKAEMLLRSATSRCPTAL